MSLIQPLFDGPLDVVGDIHGQVEALVSLIKHLGYDAQARHPQGRRLVFVGDLCDRGPNSPAVISRVAEWVGAGRAQVIVGNHEMNLLANDAKDGSGWFFDSREASDNTYYTPYVRSTSHSERDSIRAFFAGLPVALERCDLRIVHAAWMQPQIDILRGLPLGSVAEYWNAYEAESERLIHEGDLNRRLVQETREWPHSLEDGAWRPQFLPAHAEKEHVRAQHNPIKVLVSGVEQYCYTPFFAGNKWRFMKRVKWWDDYCDSIPVVIGHYWRRSRKKKETFTRPGNEHVFEGIPSYDWHGRNRNVFCVDYSVGGRWVSRRDGIVPLNTFRLAAMRWPERDLVFDDGERLSSN